MKLYPVDTNNHAAIKAGTAAIAPGTFNVTISSSSSGLSVNYSSSSVSLQSYAVTGCPTNSLVTCCSIQKVFNGLISSTPAQQPGIWQWQQSSTNVYNYVTVTGDVFCDQPLFVPSNTYLVLNGKLTASPSINMGFATALISMTGSVATSGSYSGVIAGSPGATIDCNYLPYSGVKIFNATNALLEGITVQHCGTPSIVPPILPAVLVMGFTGKNTSEIAHCNIINNPGIGVLIQKGKRVVVYKNTIQNSSIGVALIVGSQRTIVTGNTITLNRGNGISSDSSSTLSVFEGNTISMNTGNGVAIFNAVSSAQGTAVYVNGTTAYTPGTSQDNIIMRNTIFQNGKASILLSANGLFPIAATKIIGNTISGNGFGVQVGILQTFIKYYKLL